MPRTIHASVISALATDNFKLATLIEFDFDTPIRITDWDRNLTAMSNTWVSSGHFLSVSEVTENTQIRINSVTINLSGVEQTYVSLFLSEDYVNVRARIWRAVMTTADAVVGDPLLMFDGRITAFAIEDTEDSSTVAVELASHWKDFELKNGRKTNTNSQQLHFAGDLGFQFSPEAVNDVKWGRK